MTFTQLNNTNLAAQNLTFNPWLGTPVYTTGILQGEADIYSPGSPVNQNNVYSNRWCQPTNDNTTADQGALQPAWMPFITAIVDLHV